MNSLMIQSFEKFNKVENKVENKDKIKKNIGEFKLYMQQYQKTPFYKESTFGRLNRKRFPKKNVQLIFL